MGLCISVPKIKEDENHENVLLIVDTLHKSNGLSSGLASIHSQQGSKQLNQDSAILYQGYGMEGGYFCGVFDGHGENGEKVSKLVRNKLPPLLLEQKDRLDSHDEDELIRYDIPNEWRRACVSAFKIMDKQLKLQKGFDCSFSGTTAVTIIKQGRDLVIANLGDSRAILGTLLDNDKLKAVQLTVDLKPDLPDETERIRKCNGRVFAHKAEPDVFRVWSGNNDTVSLAMARAFGDFYLKEYGVTAIPHITYHSITNNDQFVVLATDGVWDALSNEEVASIVWSVQSEEEAAKAVVEAAVAVWNSEPSSLKVDDCTAVCLFLQERDRHRNSSIPPA